MELNGSPFCDYHFYTLYIGTLVLQVLRLNPPPADFGSLKRMDLPQEIEVPFEVARVIFPPGKECDWPPEKSLDWNGVVEFTHRGLPMPGDWYPPEPGVSADDGNPELAK